MSAQVELFKSIGLAEQKAKETAKNKNLADRLEKLISTTVSFKVFSELALKHFGMNMKVSFFCAN